RRHAVRLGERQRRDAVVVHVLRAALADAALGVLVFDQPAEAALRRLAEVQHALRIDGVLELVLRERREARAQEGEQREAGDAGVVARVAAAAALAGGAIRVEALRAPAAVGVLVPREPLQRGEDRVFRAAGRALRARLLVVAAAEGTA